jgi:hypothetical protein
MWPTLTSLFVANTLRNAYRVLVLTSEIQIQSKPQIYLFNSMFIKVKLSLCLTKHHAMKTYWGLGL